MGIWGEFLAEQEREGRHQLLPWAAFLGQGWKRRLLRGGSRGPRKGSLWLGRQGSLLGGCGGRVPGLRGLAEVTPDPAAGAPSLLLLLIKLHQLAFLQLFIFNCMRQKCGGGVCLVPSQPAENWAGTESFTQAGGHWLAAAGYSVAWGRRGPRLRAAGGRERQRGWGPGAGLSHAQEGDFGPL